MQKNSTKIIKKMESHLPLYVKAYSDFFREYRKSLDEICKTWNAAEQKYFEKSGIDKNLLKAVDEYWNSMTNLYTSNLDMTREILSNFLEMQLSTLKAWNSLVKSTSDAYVKSLSEQSK